MELLILKELEEKIKGLAREHALLKKRNLELEESLRNKTVELEELSAKIKEFDEERVAIRVKVDSLLELLSDVSVHE
ncbi:cell division protein ZapB [Syntrophus buswellii]|uniref:cell division protein ZapB n=1 Tax=Syntrophus TaxID=43773 RepID=UPI00345E0BC4